ncbi:hypothetical protein J6590_091693 [Homalodisca vitripennis]|nr:hypothetical protein J6590_091693 [Homalodisca vitripennis]
MSKRCKCFVLSFFVVDFLRISSDEHDSRFQESSLTQCQIPDAAIKGSFENELTCRRESEMKLHFYIPQIFYFMMVDDFPCVYLPVLLSARSFENELTKHINM